MGGSRLRAKKSVSSPPHSAARMPAITSAVWFNRGSAAKLYRLPDAPAFGSAAPKTTSGIRAAHAAPAHIEARLERDDERVTVEPPGSRSRGRVADREHLGVRGRIMGALAFVVAAGDDPTGREVGQHRTDRHVVVVERGAGFVERRSHPSVELLGIDAHTSRTVSGRAGAARAGPSAGTTTLAKSSRVGHGKSVNASPGPAEDEA